MCPINYGFNKTIPEKDYSVKFLDQMTLRLWFISYTRVDFYAEGLFLLVRQSQTWKRNEV
jgi:hypothetical protein